MNKHIFFLLLLAFKLQGQCNTGYGSIVISEIYFDTRYNEDIQDKYHSFGEYIELFNSSDEPIDLNGWTIKDNHTVFVIKNNDYLGNQTIIQPGGFKIITYNGFYAEGGGVASAIGGRQKFKELFGFAEDFPNEDIILQDRMVLFNEVDIVRLFTPQNVLVDQVSYLNESTDKPEPKDYLQIQNYDLEINPGIDNDSGGFFNGPIGQFLVYISYPFPGYWESIQTLDYSNAIYRSQENDYYSNGGTTFQVTTATPLALPVGMIVPLRQIDPFLYYTPLISDDINYIESYSYDIKTGAEEGHSKVYFDDFGRLTGSIIQDYKNTLFWGTETVYDSFGRKYKESFPSVSCFGMDNVNFISNPIARAQFLDKYYNDDNPYEEYQATADQPYSEIKYDELNPGNVINQIGGNLINGEWKTGYTYTVPAAQEMYYVYGKDYYDGAIDSNGEEVITKFYKTVSVDANGIENVGFTDGEGKVLAVARSGGTASYPVLSLIGTQGFIDIHIPAGTADGMFLGNNPNTDYKVYDLKTGIIISPTPTSLPSGNAYRVVARHTPMLDPIVYITASGGVVSSPNALGVSYNVNYYDYSVYIYNKTGQLVKNIQPKGFILNNPIVAQPSYMLSTATNFISSYIYNSLGQVIEITTPDEGTARFVDRQDGQIRYSQNNLQANLNRVSYTNYDEYARPIEGGVITGNSGIWLLASTAADNPLLVAGTKTEQTFTIYDFADNNTTSLVIPTALSLQTQAPNYVQHNLSGNVAITYKSEDGVSINAITWYSYDIYGRSEWIVQYVNGMGGVKTIDYEYDYKGNVAKVIYQKNQSDQFVHRYTYFMDNSIKLVETASGTNSFTVDAEYSYYKTGELKRTNIAQGAQGLDYVYTLGGMLKSINHPSLSQSKDPSNDSNDFFGITLDYYEGDYKRLNNQNLNNFQTAPTTGNDYVGNIKAIRWANNALDFSGGNMQPKAYQYDYNRNNWIKDAYYRNSDVSGNITPLSVNPNAHYEGNLQYDANGNITNLKRADSSGNLIDKLSYNYTSGNNQLSSVTDAQLDPLDSEAFNPLLNGTSIFTYNTIGQLTHDSEQNLDYIYNTQGLVTEVKRNGNSLVKFYYNERGQRVRKESFNPPGNDYYLLDLSGNVMSIYNETSTVPLQQKEMPIYGINRLGICFKEPVSNPDIRNYQITDHLGNVRAVIQKQSGNPYVAMISYGDYYPFGEKLDGRSSTSSNYYRYAYQGQELDKETGNEAFQLRLWDGRIGRWLSPDPYGQNISPYMGMGNNPVRMIDPNGGWCYDSNGFMIPCGEGYEDYNYFFQSITILNQIDLENTTPVRNQNGPVSNQTLPTDIWDSSNPDFIFNLVGTAGDLNDAMLKSGGWDLGRYYHFDNVYTNLNIGSKYMGPAGDIYDLASGGVKIYYSKPGEERTTNIINTSIDGTVIAVSRKYPMVGVAYGTLKIIANSDDYLKAEHDARRQAHYNKYGSWPDGVNPTATLRQASGMHRDCPTCPLEFD